MSGALIHLLEERFCHCINSVTIKVSARGSR